MAPFKSGISASDLRFLYLSPASRQALRGMRALAAAGVASFQLVGEIARRARLPANSLAKIFQRLASRRLLVSRRGPGGGYALAKAPSEISLAEILRAVQDIIPGGRHCLLENQFCGENGYCLIHDVIVRADQLVIDGLASLTLGDLARSGGWE